MDGCESTDPEPDVNVVWVVEGGGGVERVAQLERSGGSRRVSASSVLVVGN